MDLQTVRLVSAIEKATPVRLNEYHCTQCGIWFVANFDKILGCPSCGKAYSIVHAQVDVIKAETVQPVIKQNTENLTLRDEELLIP